jgi:pimeloyl-ACP methyl ester carboxylesterase
MKETATVLIENIELKYESAGDPKDPAIVFIHGWMDNRHDSDANFKVLAANHYCVRFDLPGHGESGHLSAYDFNSYLKFTKALLAKLDLKEPMLIGHSMGAVIAHNLAVADPQKYAKTVLMDPPLGPLPNVLKIFLPLLWLLKVCRLLPAFLGWLRGRERFQDLWCNIFIGKKDSTTQRAREITIAGMLACDTRVIVDGVIATLNNDMLVDLNKITDNHYVIYGELDPVIDKPAVVKYFSKNRVKVFKGAKHVPNRTHAKQFNEYIESLAT